MTPPLDQSIVRRAFSRAAHQYDKFAVLQHEVEARLLDQLEHIKSPPTCVLDLGCGSGRAAFAIKQRFGKTQVIAADLALPMAQLAKKRSRFWRRIHAVNADANALPFADASFDLIFSNLCLQWCEDLPKVLDQFRRVLKPDGLLLFSTFGPATLYELRQAWAATDSAPHVNNFAPMAAIGDQLLAAGFRDPMLSQDDFTLTYPDAKQLMRELKAIGASNAHADRPRGLTGKAHFRQVLAAYETFRENGLIPASYEVVYAQAFAPQPGQPRRYGGAEITSIPAHGIPIRRKISRPE